nr:cadmium resistance transporter [Amycolatopsis benzoatilytica]
MPIGTLAGRAVVLFAATNIDDLVVLALLFASGTRARTVVFGQYLGFAAILAVATAIASGAAALPAGLLPWLGLIPVALGIRAAAQTWRRRGDSGDSARAPRVLTAPGIAAVTIANGGDNIGAYVPVFANAGVGATTGYLALFLVLVAGWLVAGRLLTLHPAVSATLSRWGHVVVPAALIGVGVLVLLRI